MMRWLLLLLVTLILCELVRLFPDRLLLLLLLLLRLVMLLRLVALLLLFLLRFSTRG